MQAAGFRKARADDAVTDLGVVLLQHYDRVSPTREQALEQAFDALLNQVRALAQQSQLVEHNVRERTELLREIERRATSRPHPASLDEAELL